MTLTESVQRPNLFLWQSIGIRAKFQNESIGAQSANKS